MSVRWEYCKLEALRYTELQYSAQLVQFTAEGAKIQQVKGEQEIAVLIAQLGLDGWEMVGTGNLSEIAHAVYFRRRLA